MQSETRFLAVEFLEDRGVRVHLEKRLLSDEGFLVFAEPHIHLVRAEQDLDEELGKVFAHLGRMTLDKVAAPPAMVAGARAEAGAAGKELREPVLVASFPPLSDDRVGRLRGLVEGHRNAPPRPRGDAGLRVVEGARAIAVVGREGTGSQAP